MSGSRETSDASKYDQKKAGAGTNQTPTPDQGEEAK